ncbi:hypothetical protein glysoja_001742, partial [Glycine soja]
ELRLLIKPAAGDKNRELIFCQTKYLGLQKTESYLHWAFVSHIYHLGLFAKVKAFWFVRGYCKSRKAV